MVEKSLDKDQNKQISEADEAGWNPVREREREDTLASGSERCEIQKSDKQVRQVDETGQDLINERAREDLLAMGFENYETQIGDKTLEEEIEDSSGTELIKTKEKKYGSLCAIQDKFLTGEEKRKKDRVKRRTKAKGKENEKTELEGYSITDSDIQARRNVLLEEAVKTLATGKDVGLEIIGDEEEALQELVSLAKKDSAEQGNKETKTL
ncbi:hypothetical protein V6N13_014085 [Hibiscus sabdariffa]